MSNNPIITNTPAVEENVKTIEKNKEDKAVENAENGNDKLRQNYVVQTVDTKIKPSEK